MLRSSFLNQFGIEESEDSSRSVSHAITAEKAEVTLKKSHASFENSLPGGRHLN